MSETPCLSWQKDSNILNGLSGDCYIGLTTFEKDGELYCIIAFTGYKWSNSENKWIRDSSITSGLGVGCGDCYCPMPFAFNKNGELYVLYGIVDNYSNSSKIIGYRWIVDTWVLDNDITNGLEVYSGERCGITKAYTFEINSVWYLIVASGYYPAYFIGYIWNGSSWSSYPEILNGLGGGNWIEFTGFTLNGSVYLLNSTYNPAILKWTGTQWETDSDMQIGMRRSDTSYGEEAQSTVFIKDNILHIIFMQCYTFYGYSRKEDIWRCELQFPEGSYGPFYGDGIEEWNFTLDGILYKIEIENTDIRGFYYAGDPVWDWLPYQKIVQKLLTGFEVNDCGNRRENTISCPIPTAAIEKKITFNSTCIDTGQQCPAHVLFDGKWFGDTPLSLKESPYLELTVGTHNYKIIKKGYNTVTGTIDILEESGEIITVVSLTLAPPSAMVGITNGTFDENIDGWTVSGAGYGFWDNGAVHLVGDSYGLGYISIYQEFLIIREFLTFDVTLLVGPGAFNCWPCGWFFDVDGIRVKSGTDTNPVIYMGDYAGKVATLTIQTAEATKYGVHREILVDNVIEYGDLIAKPKGHISFDSRPAGAEIYLDGQYVGVTPSTIKYISEGPHIYTLKLGNFNDYTCGINVIEKQTTFSNIELTPIEGCLYINSCPSSVKIFIDDVDTGIVTPALICGLTGHHKYTLDLIGYEIYSEEIDMPTGGGINRNIILNIDRTTPPPKLLHGKVISDINKNCIDAIESTEYLIAYGENFGDAGRDYHDYCEPGNSSYDPFSNGIFCPEGIVFEHEQHNNIVVSVKQTIEAITEGFLSSRSSIIIEVSDDDVTYTTLSGIGTCTTGTTADNNIIIYTQKKYIRLRCTNLQSFRNYYLSPQYKTQVYVKIELELPIPINCPPAPCSR